MNMRQRKNTIYLQASNEIVLVFGKFRLMFSICRSANTAQDAESERLEVHVGSAAGAPKFPAPARAAVAASMTHRKQSVPLPLSPIRARCLSKLARNQRFN